MVTAEQISARLQALPAHEHDHALRLIDYHVKLLSLMPEQQRHEEYAQAELAMTHYENFGLEAELAKPKDPE